MRDKATALANIDAVLVAELDAATKGLSTVLRLLDNGDGNGKRTTT